jgi:predicted nucleic acid-binding protein
VKANKLLREQAASDGTLLEVEPRDWIIAAETIYRMENEVSKGKYQILKKASGATQRMALDTLLAVSAKRSNVIVVTENYKDFEIIRRSLHGLQIMRASDYIDG